VNVKRTSAIADVNHLARKSRHGVVSALVGRTSHESTSGNVPEDDNRDCASINVNASIATSASSSKGGIIGDISITLEVHARPSEGSSGDIELVSPFEDENEEAYSLNSLSRSNTEANLDTTGTSDTE